MPAYKNCNVTYETSHDNMHSLPAAGTVSYQLLGLLESQIWK